MDNLDKSLQWHLDQHQLFLNSDGMQGKQLCFDSLNLAGVKFYYCQFFDMRFEKCEIIDSDFIQTNFLTCEFKGGRFEQNTMSAIEISGGKIEHSVIEEIELDDSSEKSFKAPIKVIADYDLNTGMVKWIDGEIVIKNQNERK